MTLASLARRLWLWAPLVAYLGLIFHLSGQPSIPWARAYPDYLLHAAEYCVLAVLLARALNDGLSRRVTDARLGATWLLSVLYAVSDEVHQSFVPGRSPDYRDVLSDAVGAALGIAALRIGQQLLMIGADGPPGGAARAVLYSRSGCAPCFAMKRVAGRAARRHGVPVVVVDVDSDPDLRRRHGDDVPVLELPGGRLLRGRVTSDEIERAFLEASLAARPGPEQPDASGPARHVARTIDRIRRLLGAGA
ncbi:MAG TPA: VanZ family protein [Candidatus Cryosericum sp.]|nr:VanZ family protein [Candidatus Cryosericum sp.]